MKKYPLQAFLRVCKMREEQSQRELAKARAATAKAENDLQLAIEAHEKFIAERPSKEKELFAEIKEKVVNQERLDAFHLDVKKLMDHQLALGEAVLQARNHLQAMQEQENIAHKHWQEATKEHAKITEHSNIWKGKQRIIEERAEEAEMEGA